MKTNHVKGMEISALSLGTYRVFITDDACDRTT